MSMDSEQRVVAKRVLSLVDQIRLVGFRAGVLIGKGAITESNIAWHKSNKLREELEWVLEPPCADDEPELVGRATLARLQEITDANK